MLTLWAGQPECLWDEMLPIEVRELPADLAELDRVLADPELVMVLVGQASRRDRPVLSDGRPTIAMETYVRLMVLKQRYRWGYQTLVAEVSDSIHLRRFCRIAIGQRVPDESTVRKLTRRIGPETVNELTRALIVEAQRETRFRARAVRIDSTVIEADVKYPTDADLAAHGARALAREGRKLARLVGEQKRRVRDRSRLMGRTLRAVTRTIRRRSGEAKSEVLRLTEQTGKLLESSIKETQAARGGGAGGPVAGARKRSSKGSAKLEQLADRSKGRQTDQATGRGRADHRPARVLGRSRRAPDPQGKLGKPNEFGYVTQLAEVTENTRRGARGLIVPAATTSGTRARTSCCPRLLPSSDGSGSPPREVALDGGFNVGPTRQALEDLAPERVFISGRQQPGSKRTQRRAALPNRRRRTDQSPQTPLRDGPQPPQRRPRPADLDRMGDPRLQPRHARHPNPMKHSTEAQLHKSNHSLA